MSSQEIRGYMDELEEIEEVYCDCLDRWGTKNKECQEEKEFTIKKDKDKWKPSLGFKELLFASSKVREFGLKKYPPHTWKEVSIDRYFDACLRHLFECMENKTKLDSESNLPHLYHAIWNLGAIVTLLKKDLTKND